MRILGPAAAAVLLAVGGCSATPSGTPVAAGTAGGGLAWGSGDYGVVLVHQSGRDAGSWRSLAVQLAEAGMTVIAPDRTDEAAVLAAISQLHTDRGLSRVALLAAGDAGSVAFQVGRDQPQAVDQLILVSASGDASSLGVFPKLFIAATGEAVAADAQRMADEAPGDWNALFLGTGSASGQELIDAPGSGDVREVILRRLLERR